MWCNPPFSQLGKVLTKIVAEPCAILLVTPFWVGTNWMRILEKIALKQILVPVEDEVFQKDNKKLFPAPSWQTCVSLVDTRKLNIQLCELDSNILKQIARVSRKWGRDNLLQEVRKYPKFSVCETMEKEVQVYEPICLPDVSPIKKVPSKNSLYGMDTRGYPPWGSWWLGDHSWW